MGRNNVRCFSSGDQDSHCLFQTVNLSSFLEGLRNLNHVESPMCQP